MCVGCTAGVGVCSSGKVTTPVDEHGCTTEACGYDGAVKKSGKQTQNLVLEEIKLILMLTK